MSNLKSILIPTFLFLCLGTTFVSADIPVGYYDDLEGLCGVELKAAVKKIAKKNFQRIPYGSSTWKVFIDSDTHMINGERYWWDMYSNNNVLAPSYDSRGDMNIEHSVAKSWWGGSDSYDSYYDVFHLNPSDATANQRKSNYPLGIVGSESWSNDGKVTKIGKPASGYGGGSTNVYEPCDEYKGDFARVFFYIFTLYDDISWSDSYAWMYDKYSDLTLKPWAYQMLLNWSNADPISQKEIDRNEAVKKHQGNRNPFIDCPNLAEYIWGSLSNVPYHFNSSGDDNTTGLIEISEDFSVTNVGLPMGSNKKPSTATKYSSVETGIDYEIMGCYVNNYESPYYLLINGKNNAGAYISFTLPYKCTEIKMHTTPGCSTNANSAVNVYANGILLGKYNVNKQSSTVSVAIPSQFQKASTVYKIESVTTAYNQQFAGFTYVCYKEAQDVIEPTSISINNDKLTIKTGETSQLYAIIEPYNATNQTVTWKSSNSNVAMVSASGLVTGISIGESTITASCGSLSATCNVKVVEDGGQDDSSLNPDFIYPEPTRINVPSLSVMGEPYTFIYNNVEVNTTQGAVNTSYFSVYANYSITFTATKPIKGIVINGMVKANFVGAVDHGNINYLSPSGDKTAYPVVVLTNVNSNSVTISCTKQMRCYSADIYFYDNPSAVVEGGILGIENVLVDDCPDDNAPLYNLQGIKVGADYKGVVIQNGRKFQIQ